MQKRINKNNNGKISIGSTILLIVIGLIIWQYVLPFFNIASLTEIIGIEEQEPDEITFSSGLFNTYTDSYRSTNFTLHYYDHDPRNEHENLLCYDLTLSGVNSIENHQVIIITNAPKRLINSYRVIIIVEKVTWTHEVFQETIYTKSITSGNEGDKIFKRQLLPTEILLSGALHEYSVITCRLLDYTGNIIHTERWSVR